MSNPFTKAASPRGTILKFNEVGTEHTIQLTEPYTERQATEFVKGGGRGAPKFFPSGDPIMDQWISGLDYNAASEEEAQAIIIVDKVAMRRAIGKALGEAQADDMTTGGVLTVKFTGYGVAQGGNQPPKEFEATYIPPAAPDNAWGSPE